MAPWIEHPFHCTGQVKSLPVVQHMKPPTYLENWGGNGGDGQARSLESLMDYMRKLFQESSEISLCSFGAEWGVSAVSLFVCFVIRLISMRLTFTLSSHYEK